MAAQLLPRAPRDSVRLSSRVDGKKLSIDVSFGPALGEDLRSIDVDDL
jgi:hypothetical protein